MKTVLYMHSGSGNHGCEAIVRTTALNADVVLWSQAPSKSLQNYTEYFLR